jgi:hypothetical protein
MAMATVQVATAKPTANHRDNRQGKRNGNRGLSHYLRLFCLIADLLGIARAQIGDIARCWAQTRISAKFT